VLCAARGRGVRVRVRHNGDASSVEDPAHGTAGDRPDDPRGANPAVRAQVVALVEQTRWCLESCDTASGRRRVGDRAARTPWAARVPPECLNELHRADQDSAVLELGPLPAASASCGGAGRKDSNSSSGKPSPWVVSTPPPSASGSRARPFAVESRIGSSSAGNGTSSTDSGKSNPETHNMDFNASSTALSMRGTKGMRRAEAGAELNPPTHGPGTVLQFRRVCRQLRGRHLESAQTWWHTLTGRWGRLSRDAGGANRG
jgi:hypothetical protein